MTHPASTQRPPIAAPPGFWMTLARVYRRDTALEWGSPASFLSLLLFAAVLCLLYRYALAGEVFRQLRNVHGLLLATLFFGASFAAARNVQAEKEAGALRVFALSPADPTGYYLGKVLAQWQLLTVFAVCCTPLYLVLLSGRGFGVADLLGPIAFLMTCALSLASLGVMLSYVAAGNRLRELVLPLILFPASLPVLILAADGLRALGPEKSFPWSNLAVLLAPAAIFGGLGSLVYQALTAQE